VRGSGIDAVTPHTLRRSVGSWLADAGTPILDVAAYLGHSRTQVTLKHYARSLDERGARVAATIETLRTS
jgi:integrase